MAAPQRQRRTPLAEFTGERVIPGLVDPDLWNEHVARYVFASRFAAGRRVVDAGCGTGYGTARLAATAASAIGLDASSEAVAYAREHYSAENISFLQASCAALPLASASADLIVSFEVIEHIDCWQEFLVETRRVLGDTGLLIISTPNRDYYTEARATTGANPYHVHEFDFAEFTGELRRLFPNVAMLLQNHVAGIAFQPCAGPDGMELAVEKAQPAAPEDAHFFLALCSAAPLPEARAQLYLPGTSNMLRERLENIEKLRLEKEDLVNRFRRQHAELEASNSWAMQLDAELKRARARIADLQEVEEERTAWALRLQEELAECTRMLTPLRHQLALVRQSRWIKLGRKFGLGPELDPE